MLQSSVLPKKLQTRKLGNLAEGFAVRLLKAKGYKIIDRNFRGRFGEIDIIAIDRDTLVFAEVKARWSLKYGNPEEAVTRWKIEKIKRTAEYFSLLHSELPKKLRIDVVSLEISAGKIISSKIIKVY